MSFNSSVDSLHPLDPTTENLTHLTTSSTDHEDVLSVEEVRDLLSLPTDNTLGTYQDLHTIGVGGFGTVYAAREPGLERRLALKMLRPRYRDNKERIYSFIREARITAKIAHPNIVPVHRLGVFNDAGIYFSMKRVAGETLRAILHKMRENRPGYQKKYSLPRLLDIFIGACQGVSYAHQKGILHCDLKPENLMVGDFGEVLVMDWGMARSLPGSESERTLTLPDSDEKKQLGGTPVFMAPEHLSLSSAEPTVHSDIYALGCVLYTILTWKSSPFEGVETLEEIQKKVVLEKVPPPRRNAPATQPVPRELESICLKAMARTPEKRYESVNALIEDLRHYRDGLPVNAYASSPIYKFSKLFFRRPLIPMTIFLALVVWCGFSLYSVFNDYIFAESQRLNAINTFRNGEKKLLQVKKRFNQLKKGAINLPQMQILESSIAADAADAEASFKTTLDTLERIPLNHRNPRNVDRTVGQIFRTLAEFYNITGDDEKLHRTAVLFNERWHNIFARAKERDPDLNRAFIHALSGCGTLLLHQNNKESLKWHIENNSGKIVKNLDPVTVLYQNKPHLKIELPLGIYWVVISSPQRAEVRIPLRSSLTTPQRINLSLPGKTPPGMVLIPGGDFTHTPEITNNFRRRSYEKDFFIKKTEVSVAEYMEFWKSLKDPVLKKRYASYFFVSPNSMQGSPAWDDNGKLLRPGLTLQHPVTGISGHAADAFCKYLSKKLKRPVALPSRAQWNKATGGIDGTEYSWGNTYQKGFANINTPQMEPVGQFPRDRSIYGVLDLSGNVREFIKVTSKTSGIRNNYAIAGGSYLSYPEVSKNSNIVYSSRGGNGIGFRYVMPVMKKKK